MKISFCIIAYNEAVTLRANLEKLYPHAHEIIICEGSIDLLRRECGIGPRSDDGTIEMLASFPDPARKIRLIQRNWLDKNEMSAAYAEVATGDILWHIDADEFYDDYSLRAVPREFDDPTLLTLNIPTYVFWKSPGYVLVDQIGNDRWFRFARVLRRTPGMSVRHIPVRRLVNGKPDESGMRDPRDPRITAWHYAWNDDARVRMKMTLYTQRDRKTTRPNWLRDVWDRWTPDSNNSDWPDGVHPARNLKLWPQAYDGRHPISTDLLEQLDLLTAGAGSTR